MAVSKRLLSPFNVFCNSFISAAGGSSCKNIHDIIIQGQNINSLSKIENSYLRDVSLKAASSCINSNQ